MENDSSSSSSVCSDLTSISRPSSSICSADDGETAEFSSSTAPKKEGDGAFRDFGDLRRSLPEKRGLSLFYRGRSQSFTSIADISKSSVEELAKADNPYNEFCKIKRRIRKMKKRRSKVHSKGFGRGASSLLRISSASVSVISKTSVKRSCNKVRSFEGKRP
eukprot:TRINITY_DN20965_c0_g1_i2.p1 TRINITY_DN20965_c0_g1~~TRINITY_DN20965_c0_g1_i2.p1  ORF type:complete len:162 (+),score=13.23 TRINITY_DN20965_c0_g1_i2:78-563(+)